jgi:hypothetical protein
VDVLGVRTISIIRAMIETVRTSETSAYLNVYMALYPRVLSSKYINFLLSLSLRVMQLPVSINLIFFPTTQWHSSRSVPLMFIITYPHTSLVIHSIYMVVSSLPTRMARFNCIRPLLVSHVFQCLFFFSAFFTLYRQ